MNEKLIYGYDMLGKNFKENIKNIADGTVTWEEGKEYLSNLLKVKGQHYKRLYMLTFYKETTEGSIKKIFALACKDKEWLDKHYVINPKENFCFMHAAINNVLIIKTFVENGYNINAICTNNKVQKTVLDIYNGKTFANQEDIKANQEDIKTLKDLGAKTAAVVLQEIAERAKRAERCFFRTAALAGSLGLLFCAAPWLAQRCMHLFSIDTTAGVLATTSIGGRLYSGACAILTMIAESQYSGTHLAVSGGILLGACVLGLISHACAQNWEMTEYLVR